MVGLRVHTHACARSKNRLGFRVRLGLTQTNTHTYTAAQLCHDVGWSARTCLVACPWLLHSLIPQPHATTSACSYLRPHASGHTHVCMHPLVIALARDKSFLGLHALACSRARAHLHVHALACTYSYLRLRAPARSCACTHLLVHALARTCSYLRLHSASSSSSRLASSCPCSSASSVLLLNTVICGQHRERGRGSADRGTLQCVPQINAHWWSSHHLFLTDCCNLLQRVPHINAQRWSSHHLFLTDRCVLLQRVPYINDQR